MSTNSMTGYGRGVAADAGIKVTVELRTVNHKQFDCRIDLPPSLQAMDMAIRERIHEQVARGSVTCRVSLDMSPAFRRQAAVVDEPLARSYVARLRRVAARLKLRDDLSAASLLSLPNVVRFDNLDQAVRSCRTLMARSLNQALRDLLAMRRREGGALRRDMTTRLNRMKALAARIERRAPRVAQAYQRALLKRIRESGLKITMDDPRLLKEVALFADRSDIAEELTRLRSHGRQCETALAAGGPKGRTLDFLVQELLREMTTIGSKANDRDIAGDVIRFKAELERVREQAQNIE